MNNIDYFLKLPSIRIWKNKITFNGLEFEGEIPEYTLGFINGAWFMFQELNK